MVTPASHHGTRRRTVRRAARIALTGAVALATALSVSMAAAPAASASGCSDWTYPFCSLPNPQLPHFNAPGRPPLVDKSSSWCTDTFIQVNDYTWWVMQYEYKHDIRFWPDYWSRRWVTVGWDWTNTGWILRTPEQTVWVDCDA